MERYDHVYVRNGVRAYPSPVNLSRAGAVLRLNANAGELTTAGLIRALLEGRHWEAEKLVRRSEHQKPDVPPNRNARQTLSVPTSL